MDQEDKPPVRWIDRPFTDKDMRTVNILFVVQVVCIIGIVVCAIGILANMPANSSHHRDAPIAAHHS